MTGLVIDTSAAVAMLRDETGGEPLRRALEAADVRLLSAASLVELTMVMEGRRGPRASGIGDQFVRDAGIEVVPLDRTQADRAVEGWRRFGRGRHPAGLNLGDCFAYGLAIASGYPLLCVGNDFPQTDVELVDLAAT